MTRNVVWCVGLNELGSFAVIFLGFLFCYVLFAALLTAHLGLGLGFI